MKKGILIIILTAVIILFAGVNSNAQRYWNTAAKVSGTKYIAVTPGSTLANMSSDFTLECWFNASTANSATLFGKNAFRLLLDQAGQFLRARIQVNGTTRAYSSYFNKFSPNTWNHLIVQYDSSSRNFTFTINGNYDTNEVQASQTDPVPGTDTLFIGKSDFGSGEVKIDDIRIWNKRVDINILNKIYRTTYIGDSPSQNLVFSANFDDPATGPFNSLYTVGQGGNLYNRGAEPVNLGKNPSQTVALNTALYLDGLNDYARMKSHPDIEFTGAMSVEFWVNPDTIAQFNNYIISKISGSNGWGIMYDSASIQIKVNNTTLFPSGSVPPRKWTHIAITKPSGNGMKVYINGKLEANNTTILPPNANGDSLLIGKSPSLNKYFNGYIDGVNLSNYEKTAEEIKKAVFEITDNTNAPGAPFKTVSMNFDFYIIDSSYRAFNGNDYQLRGGAAITRPYLSSVTVPVSPTIGGVPNFPEGYTIKYSGLRIPESNTAGFMKTDSIYVSNDVNITDINFFLSLNHDAQHSLEINLYSPEGDSIRIWNHNYGLEGRKHIITVFDDQADSTLANGKYLDFGPRIKPASSINSRFTGENAKGYWKLKITDFDNGGFGWLYGWGIQVNEQLLVGAENNVAEIPNDYKLEQNYPNPFNPKTIINYQLSMPNNVRLKVYDVNGRFVSILVNEKQAAGNYSVTFDGTGLASGVYFYKLETEAFTDVKKMMLIK